MAIDRLYTSSIRNETGLFAAWLPSSRIEIGDYGLVRGTLFERMNQLKGLNAEPGPAIAGYDFTINAHRSLNTKAEALADAGVSHGKALLEVGFSKEAGVSFSAPDARISRVQNIQALGQKLVDLLRKGNWEIEHGIVVEVVTATRATIVASLQAGAQVKFAVGADTPMTGQVLANLDAGTSLVMEKGVGVKVIGEGPLTPLFRLAYLKSHWFRDPKIAFRGAHDSPPAPEQIKISEQDVLEIY